MSVCSRVVASFTPFLGALKNKITNYQMLPASFYCLLHRNTDIYFCNFGDSLFLPIRKRKHGNFFSPQILIMKKGKDKILIKSKRGNKYYTFLLDLHGSIIGTLTLER